MPSEKVKVWVTAAGTVVDAAGADMRERARKAAADGLTAHWLPVAAEITERGDGCRECRTGRWSWAGEKWCCLPTDSDESGAAAVAVEGEFK